MITKIIDNYINKKLIKAYSKYIKMNYNWESRTRKIQGKYKFEVKINNDYFKPIIEWDSYNGIYSIVRLDKIAKIIDKNIKQYIEVNDESDN